MIRDLKLNIKEKIVIEVGVFGGTCYKTGESLASFAYDNVYGTKSIPSRNFFKYAKENLQKMYKAKCVELSKAAIRDNNIDKITTEIGILSSNIIKEAITDLRHPPNAESTISKKKSSNPLIDTGLMRQSISWRIK